MLPNLKFKSNGHIGGPIPRFSHYLPYPNSPTRESTFWRTQDHDIRSLTSYDLYQTKPNQTKHQSLGYRIEPKFLQVWHCQARIVQFIYTLVCFMHHRVASCINRYQQTISRQQNVAKSPMQNTLLENTSWTQINRNT